MTENKDKKRCGNKCSTCENYNVVNRRCKIDAYEKYKQTNFSKCDGYLIKDKLINF